MLRLITDFDGPIIDVSERYYRVYQFCLTETRRPHQAVTLLSKAEFWRMKRACIPEWQIGQHSGLDLEQAQRFAQLRRVTVHTLPYLRYDQPVPGAIAALERLQAEGVHLVVMTMRRVRELEYALQQYDLARFFAADCRYCLSNDYIKTTDVAEKPLLMAQAVVELPPAASTWMVGDTEADIVAAQKHQIPVIGVLSGIRDRTRLSQYMPDLIMADLATAVKVMLRQTPSLGGHSNEDCCLNQS